MAAKDKKVLYASQEIYPYLPGSDLVYVARYLPEHMQNTGNNVRILMLRYSLVNERRNQLHRVIRLLGINVIVDDCDHPLAIKAASIPPIHIQVYFIDNADLFGRKSLFGPPSEGAPSDNTDYSIFFIRGALEAIRSLHRIPNVTRCLRWSSALAPVYPKMAYKNNPHSERAKVLFLVDGNEEEGRTGEDLTKKLKSSKTTGNLLDPLQGETTPSALRRMVIHYSDGVVLGQESVSPELIEYLRSEPDHRVLEHPGPIVDHARACVDFYRSLTE